MARSSRAFSNVFCRIAFASARGATYNLGQIERVIADGVENEVLEPVDDVKELLTQRRHDAGGRSTCAVLVLLLTLAFYEVNNNGLRGFEMGAIGAQGLKPGSEDTEMARAGAVPGCLLNWD